MESEMGFSKVDQKAQILVKDGEIDQKGSILVEEEKDGIFTSKLIDCKGKEKTEEEEEADIVSWGSSSPCSGVTGDGFDGDSSPQTPQTPKQDVFDPFAPGPEEMCLAPQVVKKLSKEVKISVTRRLDFGVLEKGDEKEEQDLEKGDERLEKDSGGLEEERLLETMYESFLDAIVTNQTESIVIEEDGLKTPAKVPFLSGIAEACPAAPKKPRAESRKIDTTILCRKLEF